MAADDRDGGALLSAAFGLDAADAAAFERLLARPLSASAGTNADDEADFAPDPPAPPRGLPALARALGLALGVPVEIRPQTGAWIALEPDRRARLGTAPLGQLVLGQMALGRRVWDQSAGVTLRIGPLDGATFEALLPGGQRHPALAGFVRARLGPDIAIEVFLMPEAATPTAGLGGVRLGWSARLGGDASSPARITL